MTGVSDHPKRNGRDGTMSDGARHDIAEQLIVYRRRGIAARLRRAGSNWQAIADHGLYPDGERLYPEGTSKAQVYMDVKRGLQEASRNMRLEIDELREQESERLDDYLLALEPGITLGDPKAINAAVRISDQRAKLYDLYAPKRHEVITHDALDVERKRLLDEIGRRAALAAARGGGSSRPPGAED